MKFRATHNWIAAAALVQFAALAAPLHAQGLRSPSSPVPSASTGGDTRAVDFIVAVVNSEPITNSEVRARMARVEQQLAQQGEPAPPRAEVARQVLERLIAERAQLQLAREGGLRADDALVDLAEQNVARRNELSVADFRRRLASEGVPLAAFRDELRDQVLLTRLRDREVDARVKVTDADIDQYIREQKSRANDPSAMELNLAHILVAVPPNATEAQVATLRTKATRLQERARAGEDFAALARDASDAPGAAASGGVVGLRPADRYPPAFLQATAALPEGGVTGLLRSSAGFHVVKVLQRRQADLTAASVVQSRARHILLRPGPQLSESAVVAQLNDFKRRVQAGQADFAQLAREHSQDGSAPAGGDLAWANPGVFVPEFEEALSTLAPGQLSGPVTTRFGVHLIQLLERRSVTLSEREQRESLRAVVREKKLDEAYARWVQDVRARAYVELREAPRW